MISLFSASSFAARVVNTKKVVAAIFSMYDKGEYEKAIKGLEQIQVKVADHAKNRKNIQGLIYYWKGLCYIKLNEFEQANEFLKQAIDIKFNAKDIYYEYAQSLYALDELKKSRIAFKKSVRNKYKVAVSLYYIAYISQQLKDFKKAVVFYNAIEKLPNEQKQDVIQAARMQVADIYLKQVEKMPNTFKSVEKYVIPQYEKALEWDKKSKLADDIREKIKTVQRRYDLLLFKMRNGVPTADPRHFVKFNALYGTNSNVNASDEDSLSTLNAEDYSSAYYTTGLYARYTLYPNSSYSISPEFDLSYNNYLSDSDYIKPNNSLNYRVGLQLNYEHVYNNAPATLYLNLDYSINEDDADSDDKIEKESTKTAVTISEGIQLFVGHPSTLRYRFASTKAVEETNSFVVHSAIWEQILNRGSQTFFFYTAFDMTVYAENETLNSNAFTLRGDWLFPTLWGVVNPILFASTTMTNYVENTDRGITNLMTYGLSLNRPLSNKWYMTFDYAMDSQSGKEDTDVFNATKMSLNLEYIY
jgi:tetratricopeptide (TPR) repeat protein